MALAELYGSLLKQNPEEGLNYAKNNNVRTSLRVRLIIFSLAQKLNTKKTNQLLQDNYCEMLYARNIHDATLMYALNNKLSLEEWLVFDDSSLHSLEQARLDIEASGIDSNAPLELERLHSRANPLNFGLSDLEAYCEKYDPVNFVAENYTAGYTKGLETNIDTLKDTQNFQDFIIENAEKFVATRQRTRWHFIVLLRDYINYHTTQNTKPIAYCRQGYEVDSFSLFFEDNPARVRIPGIIEQMDIFFNSLMLVSATRYTLIEEPINVTDTSRIFENFFRKIITGRTDVTRNFFIMFSMFVSESIHKSLTLAEINRILCDCGFTGIEEGAKNGLDCYVESMLDYQGMNGDRLQMSEELILDIVDENILSENIAFLYDSRRTATATTLQSDTASIMHNM